MVKLDTVHKGNGAIRRVKTPFPIPNIAYTAFSFKCLSGQLLTEI